MNENKQRDRKATQRSVVFHILVGYCGTTLTADTVDTITEELLKEMREGGASWAFSQSNN